MCKNITREEILEIKKICEKYNYDSSNEIIKNNICSCLRAEKIPDLKFGRNELLLGNYDIISHPNFPTASRTVAALIGYYKTKRTNDEMPSGQVARQAQTLRSCGFVFRKGKGGKNFTFWENGKEYREIIDFNPNVVLPDYMWNKLSPKQVKILKDIHNTDFLGNHCLGRDREIDHRIPQIVLKNEGLQSPKLILDNLIDGSYDNNFQIISGTTNKIKREACSVCMRGETIPLPPALEIIRHIYRQTYGETSKCCVGCFWHNCFEPLYEKYVHIPGLINAKNKHQKIVEKVKEKFKYKG